MKRIAYLTVALLFIMGSFESKAQQTQNSTAPEKHTTEVRAFPTPNTEFNSKKEKERYSSQNTPVQRQNPQNYEALKAESLRAKEEREKLEYLRRRTLQTAK
jgi:hypothetical protein